MLLPTLAEGAPPAGTSEVVVTSGLAARLGLAVGDSVTFIAPPFPGWFGTDGRIGQVIEDSQRGYTVCGVVAAPALEAWALDGWLAPMVTADPVGVDGHWLVVGPEPVTWAQAKALNQLQAFATSRHVLTHYPAKSELYPVAVDPEVLLFRLVSLVIAGALGAALVLLLITPAFAVATDQSRRTLALAAATGAAPRDLRRIVTAQGLVVGLAGGGLGAALGTAAAVAAGRLIYPGRQMLAHFPWWALPLGIALAALLGVVATLWPARTAARLQVVDALKDRPALPAARPAALPAAPHASRRGGYGRWALAAGLLLAAAGAATAGLALPLPSEAPAVGAGPDPVRVAFLLATLGLAAGGLALAMPQLPGLMARVAGHLPSAARLALRDAADHRPRFLPAAVAVLAAVGAASYTAVLIGSATSNARDSVNQMVGPGHLIIGAYTSVNGDFDRLVLTDALMSLTGEFPVTGTEPVYSVPPDHAGEWFRPVLPADRSCPEDRYPDTASAVALGASLNCVEWERAYTPGAAMPWMGGSDILALSGDALRASGLPGADAAAAVLDQGGVVVNNAALVKPDGTVRLAVSQADLPDAANAERFVELPGAFLRGFAPLAALSPAAAPSAIRKLSVSSTPSPVTFSEILSPSMLNLIGLAAMLCGGTGRVRSAPAA
jgi:putative ABC transport system permease protein